MWEITNEFNVYWAIFTKFYVRQIGSTYLMWHFHQIPFIKESKEILWKIKHIKTQEKGEQEGKWQDQNSGSCKQLITEQFSRPEKTKS